jgi:hypothetical protein
VAAVGVGFVSSSEARSGVEKIIRETRKTAALISKAVGYIDDRTDHDLHLSPVEVRAKRRESKGRR